MKRREKGLQLDAVVIETTGMADPAPVAQTFFVDDTIQKHFRLDGIVTLIDAKHIEQHLDEEKPEGAENEAVEQVAFADRLLVNKIDLMPDTADLRRVEYRLRQINKFAPIVRCEKSQVSVDNVLDIRSFDLNRTIEMDPEFLNIDGEHEHDASVTSVGIDIPAEVDLMALQGYIGPLLRDRGADLYRMKGVLAVEGCQKRFVYQAVHMIFTSGFTEDWGADEEKRCKLTFIGKNLDHDKLRSDFMDCVASPENYQKRVEALRFKIGDRVECSAQEGWSPGVVVDHFYREDYFEPGETVPYQIKLDNGDLIYAPADDDRVIRKASSAQTPAAR